MSKSTTPGVPGQDQTSTEPTTNPATQPEGDLLAEVEASDNAVIASLPGSSARPSSAS